MTYLWLKTLHIVLIASWFAGLFYLPRIFVNLAQETNSAVLARLLGMAQRLLKFSTILALLALLTGVALWWGVGIGWGAGWMSLKLFLVILVVGYHHACSSLLKKFLRGGNTRSHVWYRWFNEVPVVLLLVIVALVVFKPNL